MKKSKLLNSSISEIISKMGHTDLLVIADSGFPIPKGVRRIDIALTQGIPSFEDTLEAVLSELIVESVYAATECEEKNTVLYNKLSVKFKDQIEFIKHEEMKEMSSTAAAVIRTGECKPYANVILKSGVGF